MNKTEAIQLKELPGVAFAKAMLERKRQAQKDAIEKYKNDLEKKKALEDLKKGNAERGTPVIRLDFVYKAGERHLYF